jgi:hypothetical protein
MARLMEEQRAYEAEAEAKAKAKRTEKRLRMQKSKAVRDKQMDEYMRTRTADGDIVASKFGAGGCILASEASTMKKWRFGLRDRTETVLSELQNDMDGLDAACLTRTLSNSKIVDERKVGSRSYGAAACFFA